MKIAVIADEEHKNELLQKPVPAGVLICWLDSHKDLAACPKAEAVFDLNFTNEPFCMTSLRAFLPRPVFINSVVETLLDIGAPFIRINAWPSFLKRQICEIAVRDEVQKNNAVSLLGKLNWDYRLVPDVPGMISARIVAMIVNEAYYTLQEGVSSRQEIDAAMKLGTNYPWGPFEWSEKIGLKPIYALIAALGKNVQRYRPSAAMNQELEKLADQSEGSF